MAICWQKSVTLLKFNIEDAWDLPAGWLKSHTCISLDVASLIKAKKK